MPPISDHHSRNSTKLLLIGESGTGKTGALVSLVLAGYKLRIIDLDNGIDILRSYLTEPASPYASALRSARINIDEAVRYVTITEHMKSIQGRMLPAKATVWPRTIAQLMRWTEPDGVDLGEPRSWPSDTILVLDSFSRLSDAAMNAQQALSGQLGTDTSTKGYDMRADIRIAQAQLRKFLEMLYDDDFKPNVIVTAHIRYLTPEGQSDGDALGKRGFPDSIGAKLSPQIARCFNNVLQCVTTGSGQAEKHEIVSVSWNGVSAKSSAPARVKARYDIKDGLAEFFAAVRGETKAPAPAPAPAPALAQ